MKTEVAELLIDHNFEIELYLGYSGRGMYGKKTTAVVCDEKELFRAIASILEHADDEDRSALAKEIENGLGSESMGLSKVYY